jgi:transposase
VEKVYLAQGNTDLRKLIDGLAILVQEAFELDPFSPCLFVFCNRKRDKVKILQWDHNGFCLHYRRFEKGTFHWPSGGEAITYCLNQWRQLNVYLQNGQIDIDNN